MPNSLPYAILAPMLDLRKQTLFIVAPHPDDEVLGCGGLIKKIKDAGGKVYVLFLTVGNTNDYSQKGFSSAHERIKEIEKVAKFLQYDDYTIAFPGNGFHLKLDQVPQKDIINQIENGTKISLNKIKPTIVATPHHADYNQDHRSTTQAVFAATRPAPDDQKPLQKMILGCEPVITADWWDTTPRHMNMFISLSDKDVADKISALKLYQSQIRNGAHTRSLASIKHLAYFRGIQAGTTAAEAYYCYRIIV